MFQSRLPEIAAELEPRMDGLTLKAAELVKEGAQARVPQDTGKLHDAIHVQTEGPGAHMVIAGDNTAFYGHIVEHGGAHTPPRPFLIPATEEVHGRIGALGIEALSGL